MMVCNTRTYRNIASCKELWNECGDGELRNGFAPTTKQTLLKHLQDEKFRL
jgi:hypothetical protein